MAFNSRITSRDQKASLIEDGGITSASGAILFTDADSSDTHMHMSSLYSVNGVLTSSVASDAYGAFKVTPNTDSTGGRTGNLGWTYTVGAATQGLARGEVRTETYRVAITDSSGGSSFTDVVITLTGTNDSVMKVEGAQQTATVVEDSAAAALKKTGVVEFTDADLRDTHAVSFTGTAKYGTFTVVKNADSTNGAKGKVTWTYTGDNAKLQALGNAGGTETFNISITDGQGATLIVPVTVTLQGSNDAVVFTTATQRGSVVEDTVLTTQGSVTFSDVELGDKHTASIAGAAGSSKDGTYGTFSLVGGVVETLGSGRGSQGWKYTVDHAKSDFLGRGQTMTETFTVNVFDGFKTVGQVVTITITGTNDLVLLSSAASNLMGDVTENLAMKTSATGVVAFTDVDLIDTHAVSFTGTAKYGSFALGTFADSKGTGAGSVGWTYTLDARSESLAEGQKGVTETFMVQVTDRQGSTLSTPVTITLRGANDAVMITSGDRTEALVEDSGLLLTDAGDHNVVGYGTVTFRDVDLIDTHTTYVSVNGVPPNNDDGPVKFAVGTYGTLSLTAGEFVDSTNGVAGSQKWVYLVDNASADQLKQGEKITEEFVIYVDDGHNSVGTQLVTIVLTGTNDAPTIESTATDLSGTVIEAVNSLEPVVADAILVDGEEVVPAIDEPAALMTTGRVVGFDVDHDAVLTYGVTDAFTAQFAPEGEKSVEVPDDLAVMVSQLREAFSIDLETGVWTFDATEVDLEALGSGDELTLTFGVMVQDEFEESDSATVTITVRGTNDAPVIGEPKVLLSALVEDGGEEALSAGSGVASGQVVASDVDYHDVLSYELVDADTQATFLAAGSDEPAVSLPAELADLLDPALLSSFSIDRDTGAWTYDASALNLDALAQDDKLTLTFRVVVKDLDLAEAFTTVTVTILGTNDAPVIEELAVDPQALTSDTQASGYVADVATVSEDTFTGAKFETIVATGQLHYSDVDFGDTAVFSAIDALPMLTYVAAEDGNDNALDDLFDSEALATALQEAFTVNADGSWSLDITGLNLDALADRDQLIVRLPVHLQDSDGGFDDSEVVVTILGTNDAPMFEMDSSFSGSLTENATKGVTATEGLDLNGNPVPVSSPSNAVSGKIFFSDVDSGDHAEIDAKTTLADVGVTYAVYQDAGSFDTSFDVPAGIAAGLVDLAAAFHIADNGEWTYDATFVAPYLEALGEKDELRLTYTITLTDESQATTERELTITLTGTNDRPVVQEAVTASVTEDTGEQSISLVSGVSDVDASDKLLVGADPILGDGGLTDAVSIVGTVLVIDTDATTVQNLGRHDTAMVTATYNVLDDSGTETALALDLQTASVTVVGVNDAVSLEKPLPEMTVSGEVFSQDPSYTEDLMAAHQVLTPMSGTLIASDLDIGDTLHFTVNADPVVKYITDEGAADYVLPMEVSNLTFENAFTLNPMSATSTGDDLSVEYTYQPGEANLDFLGEGEKLTITYTVTVDDYEYDEEGAILSGSESSQDVTITITGTNDQPMVDMPLSLNLFEDGVVDAEASMPSSIFTLDLLNGASDLDTNDALSVDSDSFSYTIDGVATTVIPAGVFFDAKTFVLSVDSTAYQELADGEIRTIGLTYAVIDDSGAENSSVMQSATVTITGTNDAPVLAVHTPVEVLDTPAFDSGVTVSGSLMATDADNGAVLTFGTVDASGAFVSGTSGKLLFPSMGVSDTNDFGDIFLQGEHLALGFASTGHLGSVGSVPDGYVSDAGVFGLSLLGLDTSSGDTYIPGSPVEGFDLGYSLMGFVQNAYVSRNGDSRGFTFISSTNTSADGELSAVFESRVGDVLLTQNIHFQPGSHFFKTDVTVTNLGPTNLDDVRYVRTGDPDQDLTKYRTFTTLNEVFSQASGDAGYGLVTATGPSSFASVGYYTTDADAKVSSYGFANTNAFDFNLYEYAPASLGAYFVDGAINIAKSFGALSAGASESFSFYTFDTADLEGTLAEIKGSAGTQPLVLQGLYGTLTLAPDGAYQYVADDAKLNALGMDVSVTDTFTVAVSDEFGAVDQKPLTFSLVGANDTPTVVSELSLSVQEDSGISTVDLLMGASDVDTDDSVSVDGESIVYSVDGGVAVAMAPVGVLFDGDHTLSVDASSAAFQGLRDGQTLDLTVTYDITDEFGAPVAQTATVTFTGENDAVGLIKAEVPASPMSDVLGVYAEALDASAQDLQDLTVSLLAHDLDVGDLLTVTSTVKSVTLDGVDFVLPEAVAMALTSVDAFSATPATATSNGGDVAVSFSFTPAPANLDFLSDGEELVLTYTVSVDDSFGPSTQDITVTVMGTNDQPVVAMAIAAELSEDQVAETFDLITDVVTDKDAHDTLSVVDGSVRYAVDGVDFGTELPDGLVLGADGRSITIDPSLDSFDHLAAGAFTTLTVDYDVMDDSGADTDTVHATATFTVNGVNDAPMADDVTDTTMLKEAGVRTVASDTNVPEPGVFAASGDVITDHVFDVDDGATVMVSKVGVTEALLDEGGVGMKVMGTYGDLVLFADGTYTYTVDNFRAATQALKGATSSMPADVGHEAFTYEVSDGFTDGTDVAQLFLNIQGTNDSPDASDATITLTRESLDVANKAVFERFLQDFVTDPDSVALTFGRAVGQSATSEFGIINIDENTGTVTYTLNTAKVQAAVIAGGNDLIDDIRFAVRDDPQGAMDIAMLHIDVNAFAVS